MKRETRSQQSIGAARVSVRREAGTQASRCSSRRGPLTGMLLAQIQGVKDSSRIALPQWADLLTQPTATLLPPELCLAVRTISFLLAPLDLHGPEARVVILDLPSQRRPAGPPDPRPTYSASASHLPRPSEHPTDTHVSLPVPPVCSLIPQHGCARVHEADWREAVAL